MRIVLPKTLGIPRGRMRRLRTTAPPERTKRPLRKESGRGRGDLARTCCPVVCRKTTRLAADADGQRLWEAKDSEVASRLEQATELSGCKTKDSDSRKRSGSREGECDDCEQSPHQNEQEGHRRKGDVPRNERPGGNHHGQRLWEAIDSEVASRL